VTALWQRPAHVLARLVRSREIPAVEVAEAHIERALAWNDHVGALLHFEPDDVRRQARAIDRHLAQDHDPGPLAGVPVALKDNLCVQGVPTTCGSRMLETFEPPYDAHVVERLRACGAILFAKTNLDEFGMGASTEHSAFGPTRNPHDRTRTAGGSSGGSAAAVAAGMAPLALGSDTGGSIRQPAAFCGLVGVKPTYGLVSRHGLVAFASSLDQVGPLARDVDDAALLLAAIAGHDARDATSSLIACPDLHRRDDEDASGLRIGLPEELFPEDLDPEVRSSVEVAARLLAEAGARVEWVSLPRLRAALAAYYVVAPCEAASNLARYDGVRYGLRDEGDDLAGLYEGTRGAGFGTEVKRRILVGTWASSLGSVDAFYRKAQRARVALRAELEELLERVDVLLAPVTPTAAFPLGERVGDPLAMYLADSLTVLANLAGVPALAQPCGRTTGGLPLSLQWIGPRFGEALLFRAARAWEALAGSPVPWPAEPVS